MIVHFVISLALSLPEGLFRRSSDTSDIHEIAVTNQNLL